jgi:hypothetical protein
MVMLSMQYDHTLIDSPTYATSYQQDARLWVDVTVKPIETLRLRVRSRYRDYDILVDLASERSIWSHVDLIWSLPRKFSAALRYDLELYLNEAARLAQTKPEQRVRLELEARF